MEDNWFRLAGKRVARELKKLVQVGFEELLAAFNEVTNLKIDLKLHKYGRNLFVQLTLFQGFKVAQQPDHLTHEVLNEVIAGLAVTEDWMPQVRQVLQALGALHLNGGRRRIPDVCAEDLED